MSDVKSFPIGIINTSDPSVTIQLKLEVFLILLLILNIILINFIFTAL